MDSQPIKDLRPRRLRAITQLASHYTFLFWLLLFVVVVVFLLTTTLTAHYKNRRLAFYYTQVQNEIKVLKARNEAMRSEIHAIKTDPVYLETVIRSNLRMAKEGEIALQK